MTKFVIIIILIVTFVSALLYGYLQKTNQQSETIIIPEPLYQP